MLSTAVKVDPSLPNPDIPASSPAPAPDAPANGSGAGGRAQSKADSSDMSSEEDVPLSQKPSAAASPPQAGPSRASPAKSTAAEADEADKPAALAKLPPIKRNKKAAPAPVKAEPQQSESESDAPLVAKRAGAKGAKRKSMKEERCVLLSAASCPGLAVIPRPSSPPRARR